MHTTDEGELVGNKMAYAVVKANRKAWPSMNALAKQVGPHGSQDYGYRIVHRARRKGLLEIDTEHEKATPQGRGAVVITDKGKRFAESLE
jgi:hypothetical protein